MFVNERPIDLFIAVLIFRTNEFGDAGGLEFVKVGNAEFLGVPLNGFAAFAGFRSGPNGEVAEKLGFDSIAAFSYFFKHRTGKNYMEYKQLP